MHKDYVDLLSPSVREKPRFAALVSAVLSQAADLFLLYENELPASFRLSSAEGFQLDTLGALVGVPRPSASVSDADYRFLLQARIALCRWSGANGDLPAALSAAFPGRDARLADNLDGTVTVGLSGESPFPLKEVFPVPAGVRAVED